MTSPPPLTRRLTPHAWHITQVNHRGLRKVCIYSMASEEGIAIAQGEELLMDYGTDG